MEQEKLLGNLSLAGAISSLIHLVFIFDLKYNRDSQTMADILQRKFAGYGDDSGKFWAALGDISKYNMICFRNKNLKLQADCQVQIYQVPDDLGRDFE